MQLDTTDKKEGTPKVWWKRKEVWGGILTLTSTGLEMFFPAYTVANRIGQLIGIGLTFFGLGKGSSAGNLALLRDNWFKKQ